MKNPGKVIADSIRQFLVPMPRKIRVALAAASAERVLPVIRAYLDTDLPVRAIELAWAFAEGRPTDRDEIERLLTEYDALIDEMNERGDTDFVLAATTAPNYALRATIDESFVEHAIFEASDAAETGSPRNQGDSFIEEELRWQLEAAEVAARWSECDASREMFAELAHESGWAKRFGRPPQKPVR